MSNGVHADGVFHASEEDLIVGWAHMPRLEHLQLTAADANTVITQACTACTALQSLVLSGGQVLPSSLAAAAALPSLTRLEFSSGLPCTELVNTIIKSSSLRTVVLRCWIPEAAVAGNRLHLVWPPETLKRLLQRRGGDFVVLGAKGVLGEEGAWGTDVPWQGLSAAELGSSPLGGSSASGGIVGKRGASWRSGAHILQQSVERRNEKGGTMKGALRLRYSRTTLLAMQNRPECKRDLKELEWAAVVPAVLAKSAW
jgi:hypothetical protein